MSSLFELFIKGGPIMWPLLALSLAAVTVIAERGFFLVAEWRKQKPEVVESALRLAEQGDWEAARQAVAGQVDPVARVLAAGLATPPDALVHTLQRSAERELQRQARGINWLDTCITAAPLLGLLGTVTGMIRAFSVIGGADLGAPSAITGGIGEALIATSFGLGIALMALFPFNYFTARLEGFRHRLQDACTALEIASQPFRHPPA